MRKRINWSEVQRYHSCGNDRDACAARFGFRVDAWYKAIRRGQLDAALQRRCVDWVAVQHHYDEGNSYRACRERFGFSGNSWTKAVARGQLKPRPNRWPLERIMAESRSRTSIKRRLLEADLLKNRCEECGLEDWRGLPLSMQLDHRNGRKYDNRLLNLRMLCPNCHSQTSTFGARNRRRGQVQAANG